MRSRWREKIVLLTGACGGLGREFVRQLLGRQAVLVLTDRDGSALADLMASYRHGDARNAVRAAVPADLSNREGCEGLVRALEALGGAPDVVVHNAGMRVYGRFEDTPMDELYRLQQVNVTAAMHLTQRCLGRMRERRSGHLLFVCSVAGFVPTAMETAYSASKFAVRGLAMALARELRGSGVGVTIVYPIWVDTPMLASPSFGGVVAVRPPGRFIQAPQAVVRAALDGVERGRLHVYPGLWPRLAWWLSKVVPVTAAQPSCAGSTPAAPV